MYTLIMVTTTEHTMATMIRNQLYPSSGMATARGCPVGGVLFLSLP
jgi:hypothetical protein